MRTAVGLQLVAVDGGVRCRHDERDRHLTPSFVRAADDRDGTDRRMPGKDGFDLTGIKVLPAPDDDLTGASLRRHVSLCVHRAEITCVQPIFRIEDLRRRCGLAAIAGHPHRGSAADFTDLAVVGGASVATGDTDVSARKRAPQGRRLDLRGVVTAGLQDRW